VKHSHKEYAKPFLLESTKLTRIMDTIHNRLADNPGVIHDSFEVFLTGDRREEVTKLEEVLNLDNSKRKRIQRLCIVSSASTGTTPRPEHEVQVDFGYQKPQATAGGRAVVISVRGDLASWVSRTESEVEEQVERTWLDYTQASVAVIGLLVLFIVLMMSQMGIFSQSPTPAGFWLNDSDLAYVDSILSQRDTLSADDLRAVATRQLKNVLAATGDTTSDRDGDATRRALFLFVPLLVMVGLGVYLIVFHYPQAVFLWGDEEQRYASIVRRRRTIWSVILSVGVVGILSRFFYEGLGAVIGW
jgi:hypothetical protein